MNWAQKYRAFKNKSGEQEKKKPLIPPETLMKRYKDSLTDLYRQLTAIVDETMIQSKYHKLMISKDPRDSIIEDKMKVESLVLSDNDSELKLLPEGIHFIGVLGRVSIRAYQKVYSFNSIIEKRIVYMKEPHFFLIHDQDDDKALTWGYIREEDNIIMGREIRKLNKTVLERLLDEVFLSG